MLPLDHLLILLNLQLLHLDLLFQSLKLVIILVQYGDQLLVPLLHLFHLLVPLRQHLLQQPVLRVQMIRRDLILDLILGLLLEQQRAFLEQLHRLVSLILDLSLHLLELGLEVDDLGLFGPVLKDKRF